MADNRVTIRNFDKEVFARARSLSCHFGIPMGELATTAMRRHLDWLNDATAWESIVRHIGSED